MAAGTVGRYGKVLGVAYLLYICAVFLIQASFIVDPSYLHEQQRALFTYHQTQDPSLFSGDYLAQTFGAYAHPYLYSWITRFWISAGGDLVLLHRLLPLVCWLAFLAGTAVAARRLGDPVTALGSAGLAVALPLYLHQITAASPHAFAFPLLIWGLVALLYGSARGLALVTLLSGLLYVAMAPVLGLLLAWQLLVIGGFLRLARAEQLKALLLLGVTGMLSLWLVFDALGGPPNLGTPLEPLQQTDIYPENGPKGAHFYGVFDPALYIVGVALGQFRTSEVTLALAVLLAVGLFAVYGFLSLPKGGPTRKALAGFILCSVVVGVAIYLVRPYFTYRFILYPLFIVLPLLSVAGLQHLCRQPDRIARFSNAIAIAVMIPLVLAFDSLDSGKLGYRTHLEAEDRAVLEFAAEQPRDALFAVWPDGETAFEHIPYLARRPLFVMLKAHIPTHDKHTLTMRARMNALINAYLATEEAPLHALHCAWGVDYLIVDKAHFGQAGERPKYFAPFNARIEAIWSDTRKEDFLLGAPDPAWVALETRQYTVLRLAAVGPDVSDCRGSGELRAPD